MKIPDKYFRGFSLLNAFILLLSILAFDAYGAAGLPEFPEPMCPADRYGSKLNCTANDVRMGGTLLADSADSCVAGSVITKNLGLKIIAGSADRYNIGVYLANDGDDIQKFVSKDKSNLLRSCNVYTIPTSSPFLDIDKNSCGDVNANIGPGGLQTVSLSSVTLKCKPGPDGKLLAPTLVSWQQGAAACTGTKYPVPGTTSIPVLFEKSVYFTSVTCG